ncbi:hypothetical protein [Cupriavidus pinatubonensis]|nr:hypothetical protein [Cupriavidus pinatubonensis]
MVTTTRLHPTRDIDNAIYRACRGTLTIDYGNATAWQNLHEHGA